MATNNSNSTMEMGVSEQELIAAKRKKTMTYAIGGVVMVVVIALVITAVVLLSGNEGGSADALVSTTVPTDVTTLPTEPTTVTTTEEITTTTTTTEATTLAPEPEPISLDDIIGGSFSASSSFNASWVSGTEVMFRNAAGSLVLFNLDTGIESELVQNSSEILQLSSRFSEISPDRTNIVLSYNVQPVYRHSYLARYSAINLSSGTPVDIGPVGVTEPVLQNFVWGPSGTACAFVYLNNIYYKSSLTADAVQVTTTGVLNVIYHGIPDWVYEEEVFSSPIALWFSADGSRLAYASFDDSAVRVMRVPYYGVPGSTEYQYTLHHEIRYPKPGTTNPTVSATLTTLTGATTNTQISAPTTLDQPILLSVEWVTATSAAVVWTNRVQNEMLVQLCAESSTCTTIFSYSEPTGWIDNNPLFFNSAADAFITILPQTVSGGRWKQVVQLSNTGTGTVDPWTLQARTNTANDVQDILRWGDDGVIWYKATAVDDSAAQHLYNVDASGTVSCFTCGITQPSGTQCLYNDASFSSDGSRIVITCAGPGVPQTYVYDLQGTRIRVWDNNAEVAGLISGRVVPETLRLTVPLDEGAPAEVILQVPSNVSQLNNVPLLVYVYGGPGSSLVTHSWSLDWGSSLVSRWGIAIAHIDGRGSGLRGVDNLFELNRRLGTIEIEDQIAVTRYLHQNLGWVDSNRTCIWGWSYGGYASSLALLRGGDTFRCAIAVAPVTDWRYYDTIYTERYMDTPANNAAGYNNSSILNLESVEALRDKRYFLVHGTADDNVHYQHAMLLSRLLQVHDVYFHQMSYTDEDHGLVGVRPHLYHGLEKFLEENML